MHLAECQNSSPTCSYSRFDQGVGTPIGPHWPQRNTFNQALQAVGMGEYNADGIRPHVQSHPWQQIHNTRGVTHHAHNAVVPGSIPTCATKICGVLVLLTKVIIVSSCQNNDVLTMPSCGNTFMEPSWYWSFGRFIPCAKTRENPENELPFHSGTSSNE